MVLSDPIYFLNFPDKSGSVSPDKFDNPYCTTFWINDGMVECKTIEALVYAVKRVLEAELGGPMVLLAAQEYEGDEVEASCSYSCYEPESYGYHPEVVFDFIKTLTVVGVFDRPEALLGAAISTLVRAREAHLKTVAEGLKVPTRTFSAQLGFA